MNYEETIAFLYRQLPMYQKMGGAAMKKDLTNILALMKALGNPHLEVPAIHIAGTNGKGSTAHLLSSVLQTMGYRVGVYTSPHYKDFRERIKISGQFIPPSEVVNFVEQHVALIKSVKPSFFEITAAMAFWYFAKQPVDISIIETGLGGRLDSTNIIKPLVSVITNISFDHQQFLGDTLPEIAGEKAGIIKEGVPVVVGQVLPETRHVFEQTAAERSAPICYAEEHFKAIPIKVGQQGVDYQVFKDGKVYMDQLTLGLFGDYQRYNLQTVLQTLAVLPTEWQPDLEQIKSGFSNVRAQTKLMGRWQQLGEQPLIICDSAHNVGGIKEVVQQINRQTFEKLHMVIGMVKDKDVSKLLMLLPKNAQYYFAKPDIPRGLDANQLKEAAIEFGLTGQAFSSVNAALEAAQVNASIHDFIFVGGSTFVVAEVL